MNRLDYAFHHIECVAAIIAGRSEALDRMDISADGFWRSFFAIIVALPAMFFVWVLTARAEQAAMPTIDLVSLVAGEAVFEIAIWLLPIPIFALILKPLGFGPRFSHLIIARNWANALFSYVIALIYVPDLFVTEGSALMALVGSIVLIGILVAAIRVTQAALDCSFLVALAFVFGELLVGLTLAAAYFGLADPSI